MSNLSNIIFQKLLQNATQAGRVDGPVIGLVVNNKDPQKLARVEVRYPDLGGPDKSWWAHLATLGAGNERGWFFLPEIDDEVLVMFEHGDISRPIVVGALWNGKDTPADVNDGANERRTLVSRAGSKVIFDDTSGAEKVVLEDGAGFGRITLDAVNNKIILEAIEGDVCIQAPTGEVNVEANSVISSAQKNYDVDSGSGGTVIVARSTTINAKTLMFASRTDITGGGSSTQAEPQLSRPEAVPEPIGE